MTLFKYFLWILLVPFICSAQQLKIKKRNSAALLGSQFAASISGATLSLSDREKAIYKEVISGNIPNFYRKLYLIRDTSNIAGRQVIINYYVLPDFLAIGSDEDFFYCPMSAALAQKIAGKLKCSLITRKVSDKIYQSSKIKLEPQPIPPSTEMTTVPVFKAHSNMIFKQRSAILEGPTLTAGHKKDVVISNKIYKDGQPRVVIYGWHLPTGKAIQPLYNGHKINWVDYSHGLRLISRHVIVDGKATLVKKVLQDPDLNVLLSDEGPIQHLKYPTRLTF